MAKRAPLPRSLISLVIAGIAVAGVIVTRVASSGAPGSEKAALSPSRQSLPKGIPREGHCTFPQDADLENLVDASDLIAAGTAGPSTEANPAENAVITITPFLIGEVVSSDPNMLGSEIQVIHEPLPSGRRFLRESRDYVLFLSRIADLPNSGYGVLSADAGRFAIEDGRVFKRCLPDERAASGEGQGQSLASFLERVQTAAAG